MAKILVVDDDTIIQKIMQHRLQTEGHQVLLAKNGAEGVELARSGKPDLIIMDLWMPVLNGWAATQKIKQFLDIPVIGLTGTATEEAEQKMMEAGCVGVVYKPVDFAALVAKINVLIYPSMIRPSAICIFKYDNCVLVKKRINLETQVPFFKPIGGYIEFGEHSRDAILREVWQEFGTGVANLHYLAALEEILPINGRVSHEIVQVYEGVFVNHSLYRSIALSSNDNGRKANAVAWKPLTDFLGENAPLLSPRGLLELLQLQIKHSGSALRNN